MRAVMVSLVHAPPAFHNNFQSSDKKKRSVTAESVKHNLVSSVPSFTWLKGVTPELWLQKQLFSILDRTQVATLPKITHCFVILEALSLADMDAVIMGVWAQK